MKLLIIIMKKGIFQNKKTMRYLKQHKKFSFGTSWTVKIFLCGTLLLLFLRGNSIARHGN